MKINNLPSPLAFEYAGQKKLVAQNKNSRSAHKEAKTDELPEDVVTLSSNQPDTKKGSSNLSPSQPVTFEETQALRSTFSVLA